MKIFIAGHNGMVGRAILDLLKKDSSKHITTLDREHLDLRNKNHLEDFFQENYFDEVYIAAAYVGGIHANKTYPAEFIYNNLMIQTNLIDACHKNDIQKLLFLGSSCIYPKKSNQPIKEESLLTGYLEDTNSAYAVAKIAGIEMCKSYNLQYGRDYRCVMPTNLYGKNDNFDPITSHVIPALISKIYESYLHSYDQVSVWGSGTPKREFLHVNDLASACAYLMELDAKKFYSENNFGYQHINIGSGEEINIKDLAHKISKIIGYKGRINFDQTKPDGAPRKYLDCSKLKNLGWRPSISLDEGLEDVISWYIKKLSPTDKYE